jgi:hypothetical protein
VTAPEFYSCKRCGMQSPVRYQGDVMTDQLRAELKLVGWKLFIAQESIMAIFCHFCFQIVHHKQPFGWQKKPTRNE